MGNRFLIIGMGLVLAFGAGWLFANEVRPPRFADLRMAMWIIVAVVGLMMGAMASIGRG